MKKDGPFDQLKVKKDWIFISLLFLGACALRALPEIKAGFWPIGYDVLNSYLPDMVNFDGNFLNWILSANLLYILLWPFYKIFVLTDPSLILKVAGVLLYGILAAVFYFFTRKNLKWHPILAFLAGVLLVVQLPALRLSWDLFRNILSLIFLLPAIYFLEKNKELKNTIWLGIFSLLIILSNQLVAGLWFFIVFFWVARKFINKTPKEAWKLLLSVLPSIILFVLIVKTPSSYSTFANRVIYEGESGRVFSYFEFYRSEMAYSELARTISNLFWWQYGLILPLALLGFWLNRKNTTLVVITLFLLLGSFSSLIFGGYGLFVFDRWMLMLVIPFTIFASGAFLWIYEKLKDQIALKRQKFFTSLALIFTLAYLGFILSNNWPFLTTKADKVKKPFLNKELNNYIPPTMLNNSVGFENLQNVLDCLNFVEQEVEGKPVLMVDNRYRGLALTNLDLDKIKIYTFPWSKDFNSKSVYKLRERNYGAIYTIWTDKKRLPGFDKIYTSGLVSVYRDKTTYKQFKDTLE